MQEKLENCQKFENVHTDLKSTCQPQFGFNWIKVILLHTCILKKYLSFSSFYLSYRLTTNRGTGSSIASKRLHKALGSFFLGSEGVGGIAWGLPGTMWPSYLTCFGAPWWIIGSINILNECHFGGGPSLLIIENYINISLTKISWKKLNLN